MHVEESVVINQPVEKVFGYASDPAKYPEWAGPVIDVRDLQQTAPGEWREGDRFTLVGKFLGRQFHNPSEVTAYEPNRRFSTRVTGGPIPEQKWTYTFEEASGGTRLSQSMEGDPGSFFKLVGPLLERAAKRQFRHDLETLKDLLEAQG